MYFSQDAEVANIWAKMRADKSGKDSRTIEAYLKFENPLILKWDEYLLTGAMKSNQQAMLKKIQENLNSKYINLFLTGMGKQN